MMGTTTLADTDNFERSLSRGYSTYKSWTDDLPICRKTGVGFSYNQIYREDGTRQEIHPFEDKSFHFQLEDGKVCFYLVIDGDKGSQVTNFIANSLPAEILFEENLARKNDGQIKHLLRQAFHNVERSYTTSISDILARKADLEDRVTGQNIVNEVVPEVMEQLDMLNLEAAASASVLVILIIEDRLFIAHCGGCRAVLCRRKSDTGELEPIQLNVEHTFDNEEEIKRLKNLRIDVDALKNTTFRSKTSNLTRCIGNCLLKNNYKDYECLRNVANCPLIADPEVTGALRINSSHQFLLIMSSGVVVALKEATGTRTPNHHLMKMVSEEFKVQTTLHGVAQDVVNKISRMHQDEFLLKRTLKGDSIEDMTLMIRNFNYQLIRDISPTTTAPLSISISDENNYEMTLQNLGIDGLVINPSAPKDTISSSGSGAAATATSASTTTTTSDTSDERLFDSRRFYESHNLDLDEEGRIKPYVDFSEFYASLQEAKRKGQVPPDFLE